MTATPCERDPRNQCTATAGSLPRTLGTFLRSFTWGHARQLDKAAAELLSRAWAARAGPGEAPVTMDIDFTICETYGLPKQSGTKFTHTNVRGYHPLVAVVAGTGDVVHSATSPRRSRAMLGLTVRSGQDEARWQRKLGPRSSGLLGRDVQLGACRRGILSAHPAGRLRLLCRLGGQHACRKADVRFSITVKLNPAIHKAIAEISDDDWVAIPYFLEGADVAETTSSPSGARPR